MLFMRCVFESRLDKLDLYPFPGLKVINIRGSSLLALDLIIIGNFVAKLDEKNRLLEMALRDYPLDRTGLLGLIPCIPLIRWVCCAAAELRRCSIARLRAIPFMACKGVSLLSRLFTCGEACRSMDHKLPPRYCTLVKFGQVRSQIYMAKLKSSVTH